MKRFGITDSFYSILITLLCGTPVSGHSQRLSYRPPLEKVLVILGQDMGATGGFAYPDNDGYLDHFDQVPAGFTTYTSINRLEGLTEKTNYGSGNVCAQCYLDNEKYNNSVVVLGLYMVNQLAEITNGSLDANIKKLGTWISAANRPVFVRIGYEFNASWAGYKPSDYIAAFRYLTDYWEEMGVLNFNTVWQSDGYGSSAQLLAWYPGDNYVDWMAYSHFDGKGEGIIALAKTRSKPVMIAEATPRMDLKTTDGATAIQGWFEPFFNTIQQNKGVIQAFCYINTNWEAQSMWKGGGWGDSRIQVNPEVQEFWINELLMDHYQFASSQLFETLSPFGTHHKELAQASFKLVKKGAFYLLKSDDDEPAFFVLYTTTGQKILEGKWPANTLFDFHLIDMQRYLLKLNVKSDQMIIKL
ncbi:MAG: hypothetical protein ACERKD_13520 [Prolixibacteraceae bacterium]